MSTTAIQWTDQVWNPTTGCDQVSLGCDHCYALTMAKRLKGMGSVKYQRDGDPRTSGPGFGLTMHQDVVDAPLRWRTPRRVFVNSMSDLFHQDVTDEFVAEVFVVMAMARRHTFQILTKRHARMRALLSSSRWIVLCDEAQSRVISRIPAGPLRRQKDRQWWREVTGPLPNVWLGVSVENQKWADIRIPALLDTPAVVRFVSAEPLLGPVRFRFSQCREHDLPSGGMCYVPTEDGCLVSLWDGWTRFLRQLVMTCAGGPVMGLSGTVYAPAQPRTDAEVLSYLYANKKGHTFGFNAGEPKWNSLTCLIDIVTSLGLTNEPVITNALTASNITLGPVTITSPLEEIRICRNYVAHKNTFTLSDVLGYAPAGYVDFTGHLRHPRSGVETFNEWKESIVALAGAAAQ